jgi:MFS family permease
MAQSEKDLQEPQPTVGKVDKDYTQDEERAVVRKIDMIVLPLVCGVFFAQYLDKQSLTYSAVFGLTTDLHMSGSVYSWCSSIFYLGQLGSEFVFIYLMSRFPLSKLVGITVVLWAIVCLCLAAPTTSQGFLTVRFFLGVTEGCVSPAFVTITSTWYRKREHALRVACWVSMNALAQVIGCLLMYGIGKQPLALAAWRVMFLVCGAITLFLGVAFVLMVPVRPDLAWFLNDREKFIATERLLREADRGERSNFDWKQCVSSLRHWNVWMSFLFGMLVTLPSFVITFVSLILKDFGYSNLKNVLYSAPSGAVQFAMLWIGVGLCALFPNSRSFVACALIIVPIIGSSLLLRLPRSSGWGVITASWLGSCITAFMSILLSLNASNIRGNTKKSVANAMFFIGYCLAAIIAPQWWNYSKDPTFNIGLTVNIAMLCLLFVLILLYYAICVRENRRRDGLDISEVQAQLETAVDKTDVDNLAFRYST